MKCMIKMGNFYSINIQEMFISFSGDLDMRRFNFE